MPRQVFPGYSNLCGWNAMLPPRAPHPALRKDLAVDYAIVGAGFTGLAIARRLHELNPHIRIAVFEASTVGEGASARNSGFTGSVVLPRTATLAGADKARRQTVLMTESFDWLKSTITGNGIDCDLQKVGSIRGAATESGETSLRQVIEVAKANGIAHTVLTRKDIAERIGTDYYRFGLHLNDTYLLQPAALIRGLADCLPEGVTLFENTPVSSLKRDSAGWILRTEGGVVRAHCVALANNSFIRRFGYLKLRMTTIFTYAAVTRATSDADLRQLGQSPAWGLLPPHRLGTTLRRIGRDRLMVRSLYAHEHEIPSDEAFVRLRDRFIRRWPGLKHIEFEYVWGGATAFTMNGAPWWGKLGDGLFASGGCNGSGIAKGTMLGRHLAEMMLGIGTPSIVIDVMGTASLIVPEPFRSIGFRIVSAIESRKAGLES